MMTRDEPHVKTFLRLNFNQLFRIARQYKFVLCGYCNLSVCEKEILGRKFYHTAEE